MNYQKNKKTSIYIYQRILPHYRIPFFRGLAKLLLQQDIQLVVVYGQEYPGTVPKTVMINEDWAIYKKNIYIKIGPAELVIQPPLLTSLFNRTAVVLEQANRLMINYVFFAFVLVIKKPVALWGHGKNFQSSNTLSLREKFKRAYTNLATWWFCYTPEGKNIIANNGFNSDRITVVANSIDTTELANTLTGLKSNDLEVLKNQLGITSSNVAIYCGGMYTEKRITFLLQACQQIRQQVNDFEMIFIGDGPDLKLIETFCEAHTWSKYVGKMTGNERVKYFALAKCQLMPGLVGLGIIDSFALGVPLVTTNIDYHSPEIEYMAPNVNGIITDNTVSSFVTGVTEVFLNSDYHNLLVEGCYESREMFSLENMIKNYADGITSFAKEVKQ
jgi:glycosyltransferase involved in cell wall biosynthesis